VANAGDVFVRVRNVVVTYPAASRVTAQVQSAVLRLRKIGSRARHGLITSKFVVEYFERHTGEMLNRIFNPGILGFSPPSEILEPPNEAKRRYGDFRIDVFHTRAAAEAIVQPGCDADARLVRHDRGPRRVAFSLNCDIVSAS
jgi:hypothetical protein